MSIHVTIPTITTTLPTPAKPHATADSNHYVPYEKQHKNQIIGGAVGGFVAVLLAPATGPGTAIRAQKSRHQKEASRHTTLKVSNPDPNGPGSSDSGSSASKDAAAAPGFVAGPEYDPGDPDAIHTISNEPSAGMKGGHSLNSDWPIEPSPQKRKSLSPLKPAVLSKSDSRPKPKKSILKKHRKHSPDLPVEPKSESNESEEGSKASSSGEGPSKTPTDNQNYTFEDFASDESRLGFPETFPSRADIGMLKLKDLTSPQRETSPIPSPTSNESPDPTQTLKDSIDHRAEMRKRKSAVRGSTDSKQSMGEDRKGSRAGQESFADDHDKPELPIRSEAREGGIGDTESQTEYQQDCAESPSPSEQAGSPSQSIEMGDTGQEDRSTGGGDQMST
ncbi:MAG: hypothetical protein OHK93_002483 [Ramalina farinacea]|uniref:Uncharacterized protein n=1 Tax=Ramalina farinacea TaxID=258253 RepID=A0AA43QT89_9LECA|nr:hypothetical protein [Ramalina farinacea]